MNHQPPAATKRPLDPVAAVDELERLYAEASSALRASVDRFLKGEGPPSPAERARFRYPELRVTYAPDGMMPVIRRAFGKFQAPGVYATTVTHPQAFRTYLVDQLRLLTSEYGATLEVRPGAQEIPYPYVFETGDDLGRDGASAGELARLFPVPLLSEVGDEIADCTYTPPLGDPQPLALFDALRVDYSLRRLVHYTGSDWRNIQPWILLTNYHRYVDQFVAWGLEQLQAGGRFEALVLPSGVRIDTSVPLAEAERIVAGVPWHRYQMPAYHLVGPGGGVTLVNIGVGPANAKNITDHLAVLRPHCWLMVGHCGGLRQSQQIGDYVLAHAYLREDRVLDEAVPTGVPIPALAEVQVALQEAAARITGDRGEALKNRLRTGTVVTYDDRNWELRWTRERTRINQSRAIAVDMESGTIATQGFRMRVPYGTLLCVSDKPLHGEIKLPGSANAFYERAVKQHLLIGLEAVDILRQELDSLHSRKLRSFDEPPFR